MTCLNYTLSKIDAFTANEFIKKYHYSKKTVSNTSLHLGVFKEDDSFFGETLVGVLQYGYPMNGEKTASKISNSKKYMESNGYG